MAIKCKFFFSDRPKDSFLREISMPYATVKTLARAAVLVAQLYHGLRGECIVAGNACGSEYAYDAVVFGRQCL